MSSVEKRRKPHAQKNEAVTKEPALAKTARKGHPLWIGEETGRQDSTSLTKLACPQ
jgi:hypothetical protein